MRKLISNFYQLNILFLLICNCQYKIQMGNLIKKYQFNNNVFSGKRPSLDFIFLENQWLKNIFFMQRVFDLYFKCVIQCWKFIKIQISILNNPAQKASGNRSQSSLEIKKSLQTQGVHHRNEKNSVLYFMKGNQQIMLNEKEQKEILELFNRSSKKTSLFIYNSTELHRIYEDIVQKFPWIKPHYAVKTNPREEILRDLVNLGAGFDCASQIQIQTVLNLGAKPDAIVYSNPIKDQNQLEWAGEIGISLTVADSYDEIVKIKEYAPNMDILWRIAIPETSTQQKSYFAHKFGDDLEDDESIHFRMKFLSEQKVNIKGIHFHCGSKVMGTQNFARAIQLARRCMEIGRQYGHQMSIMDIGSGFAAREINQKTVEDIKVTQHDQLGYTTISQPGRRFASNCYYLLTKVIGRRVKNGKVCYHINDSIYHTFNIKQSDSISFDNASDQFYSKLGIETNEVSTVQRFKKSTIFGITCDGLDVVASNIQVPEDLKIGDWICVGGMGAYTASLTTQFNGMKCGAEIQMWHPQNWRGFSKGQKEEVKSQTISQGTQDSCEQIQVQ